MKRCACFCVCCSPACQREAGFWKRRRLLHPQDGKALEERATESWRRRATRVLAVVLEVLSAHPRPRLGEVSHCVLGKACRGGLCVLVRTLLVVVMVVVMVVVVTAVVVREVPCMEHGGGSVRGPHRVVAPSQFAGAHWRDGRGLAVRTMWRPRSLGEPRPRC